MYTRPVYEIKTVFIIIFPLFVSVCGAYTMDVIASTAFSVKVDSHNDPNNQFVQMAKKAFMFNFTSPKFLILCMFTVSMSLLFQDIVISNCLSENF